MPPATAKPTVTKPLTWVRAPARWLTAVWENPPAGGSDPKNAPATAAMPFAVSSWLLSIDGSSGPRTLRATDTVSR